MSTRGGHRNYQSYQQQPFNQQRPRQPYGNYNPAPQGSRAPLIPTTPPNVMLYGARPPSMMFPQAPRPQGHYGIQFAAPPMHQAALYHHQMQSQMGQNPTQIISNAPPYTGSKGNNSLGYIPTQPIQQPIPYHPQPKQKSKAIKIIDPDTKEEVDTGPKTTTEIISTPNVTTQSLPVLVTRNDTGPRNEVVAEFQNKIQEKLNPTIELSSLSEPFPKPNAIISPPAAAGDVVVQDITSVDCNIIKTDDIKMDSGIVTNDVETVLPSEELSNSVKTVSDLSGPVTTMSVVNTIIEKGEDTKKEESQSELSLKTETKEAPTVASTQKVSEISKLESGSSKENTDSGKPSSLVSDKEDIKTTEQETTKDVLADKKEELPKPVTTKVSTPIISNNDVTTTNTPPPQELSRDVTPPVIVSSLVAEKKEQKHPEQGGKTEVGREHIEKAKGEEKPKGEDKPRREQDKTKNSEQLKKKVEQKPSQTSMDAQKPPQTTSEKKTSLLGQPLLKNHPPLSKDSDELEDGEIPPGEENTLMNGNDGFNGTFDFLGERKYDRNFLLEYKKTATEAPEQLRLLGDLYCPQGQGLINYHQFSTPVSRNNKPRKKVIDHKPSASENVELRKAENKWVRLSDQNIPENEKETQDLFRKFQGILNKLTPQKFTDLAVKAQALDINTEERLHGCIDRIFEKALEEPNFSIAYANLCRVLSSMKVSATRQGDDGTHVTKETSFRRELLTKCQKEFEKDKRDDDVREIRLQAIAAAPSEEDKKKKQDEFDIWETKARRRSLGNIRFIGELFKLKMLSEGIMHDCILRLLRSTSDHESLECYCRLITTTGKELDHPQAKTRMDRYFQRISEIIEKKKISSRIKFMLQDVQDLRNCEWIPRRQEGLKTIDQIHHEAKIEAEAEQEMIKHMSITSNKPYNRDDKKRGVKMSGQDDMGSRRFAEKRQSADVNKILGLRKKDVGSGTSLGQPASFRPGWGKQKKDGQTPPPPVEKERSLLTKNIPQKSNSGPKRVGQQSGRVSTQQGARRSSSQPNEKLAVLEALKGITNPGAASRKLTADKLDEDDIRRKTGTIVDEFTENKDHNEARACVTEMESPGQMNILVSQCILHSIEKSPNHREYAGRLLDYLLTEKILTKDTILAGFKEVLEMADDLEVDIPKLWDFFAEVLTPLFICKCLTFNDYFSLLTDVGMEYKSPRALARLIQQCAANSSKAIATDLWTKSGLTWTALGLDQPEEEFLEREKLQFLVSTSASTSGNSSVFEDPPYFKDLVVMFGRSDTANDEILSWIETQKFEKDLIFIRSLSRASVEASTTGEAGDSCILSDERFRNRLPVIKKWVDENENLQKEILNAMQISMDKLKHPPSMLSTVLWSLYDVEVVSEKACYDWRDKGVETIGRGMALQTAKRFFDWLDGADQDSDNA